MKFSRASHLLYWILAVLSRLQEISLSDLCKSFNNLHTTSGMVLIRNGDKVDGWIYCAASLKMNGTPTLSGIGSYTAPLGESS